MALCFCGCGQEAPIGSLMRPECGVRKRKEHERAYAPKRRAMERSRRAARQAWKQATTELCVGCGKVEVPHRRLEDEQVEALRRKIQQQLLSGEVTIDSGRPLSERDAYLRSIELTAPHRLQRWSTLCPDCQEKRAKDWEVFIG